MLAAWSGAFDAIPLTIRENGCRWAGDVACGGTRVSPFEPVNPDPIAGKQERQSPPQQPPPSQRQQNQQPEEQQQAVPRQQQQQAVPAPLSIGCSSTAGLPADLNYQLIKRLEAMSSNPELRRMPRVHHGQEKRPYQLGDFFLGKSGFVHWSDPVGEALQMVQTYPKSLAARYYANSAGPCDIGLMASLVPAQLTAAEQQEVSKWCTVCAQCSSGAAA